MTTVDKIQAPLKNKIRGLEERLEAERKKNEQLAKRVAELEALPAAATYDKYVQLRARYKELQGYYYAQQAEGGEHRKCYEALQAQYDALKAELDKSRAPPATEVRRPSTPTPRDDRDSDYTSIRGDRNAEERQLWNDLLG